MFKVLASVVLSFSFLLSSNAVADEISLARDSVISQLDNRLMLIGETGAKLNASSLVVEDRELLKNVLLPVMLDLNSLKEAASVASDVGELEQLRTSMHSYRVYDFLVPQVSYAATLWLVDASATELGVIRDGLKEVADTAPHKEMRGLVGEMTEKLDEIAKLSPRSTGEAVLSVTVADYQQGMFGGVVDDLDRMSGLLGETVEIVTKVVTL